MKMKRFILLLVLVFAAVPSYAMLTDELTSSEYLINNGFSPLMADHVQLTKAQNLNQEYKNGRNDKSLIWKKIRNYIEFGYDDGTLLQHSISPSQSVWDW
ncbi:MAG: hypothetical protein ACI37S_02305 [Candidatus Gastranaerophilaceae bacterium]